MNTNQHTLEFFIDSLLSEKQFKNLDSTVRAQLHADLMNRANDHINASILAALPKEKLSEFEALLDKNEGEEVIQSFLRTNIDTMDEIVASSLLRFRNAYIAD